MSPTVCSERITAALDAIDAAHDVLRSTPSDLVGNRFRADIAERLETQERVNRGLMYRVFAEHTERPLYLGRQKRVATADQRLICYARDRGCTRPNCLVSGYRCEVHHSPDWGLGGRTDADSLFLACGPNHGMASRGELRTEVVDGRLGWTDGTGPPEINHAHNPDELLRGDPDPPEVAA
ncbi:hypothetical protein GCM10009641_03540 [Mycobacterium cookii]|uniref:DUF222 domain-containing protein n=1 Tax=Mycobacterium cookii TaxID=1775 RepID=A0A7I7L2J5_9MYCO|nr:hypothetical protein MCOO_46150 [Mycobacterium cookii]